MPVLTNGGRRKHVHSDLSSYTCVFSNCNEMLFDSRHKWWQHEVEAHRRIWRCGKCGSEHVSPKALESHLMLSHASHGLPEALDDYISGSCYPVSHIPASECPFCDYPATLRSRGYSEDEISHLTPEKFARHLGRHLEQLALFVLPIEDLDYDDDDDSQGGGTSDHDGSHFADDADAAHLLLSEPDLISKLDTEAARYPGNPEILARMPEIVGRWRWQPPHDFTPPEDDFQTDDVDMLPVRQEPIFGGDLHTPGWARGTGSKKEGFCGRCPYSHWVNISDGSYAFHLTYFHGVPDSGVGLPRPATIRPSQGADGVWEAYCEACLKWRILKRTKRGWNWYRHWLYVS